MKPKPHLLLSDDIKRVALLLAKWDREGKYGQVIIHFAGGYVGVTKSEKIRLEDLKKVPEID